MTSEIQKPSFSHQFQCLDQFSGRAPGWLKIVPTAKQTAIRFFTIFIEGLAFVILILAALYLPDFLFDYANRGDDFVAFFFKFIGWAALILIVIAAFMSAKKLQVIYVNPQALKIIECGLWSRPDFENAIEFSEIEKISSEPPSGLFKKSVLSATLQGQEVTIADCYGSNEDLIALRDWLNQLHQSGGSSTNSDATGV